MQRSDGTAASGVAYALGAYGIWGFAPIYWKATNAWPASELLAARVLWSLLVALLLVSLVRSWGALGGALRSLRTAAPVALATLLLATNWGTFIFAVQSDQVVATSLGYYVNPLMNVLLGLVVLRERLRRAQGAAVVLAAAGVVYLTWQQGELPWISIVLALSFALYGLVRKVAPAPPLVGFALECTLIAPLALLWLGLGAWRGDLALARADLADQLLIAASGLVTAAPLLCFASAARRLPLSTLGFFQYLAPSIALLLAVVAWGEPFTRAHAVAFACVWSALAIFSLDSVFHASRVVSRR